MDFLYNPITPMINPLAMNNNKITFNQSIQSSLHLLFKIHSFKNEIIQSQAVIVTTFDSHLK